MQRLQKVCALLKRVPSRGQPRSPRESLPSLQHWQQTPLARELMSLEGAQINSSLNDLFGYHLMELNSIATPASFLQSPINHCFRLSPIAGNDAQALAELECLPLENESVDVAVLHHTLDFAQNPHQVLREVNRVLIARGTLIIVGFNPVSLQGLWRFVAQWCSASSFWKRNSLRAGRVVDWMRLLDCDVVDLKRGFYRPPFNSDRVLSALRFCDVLGKRLKLPWGAYYVLVARKERTCMRPLRPVWETFNPVVGLMARPTPRLPRAVGQRHVQLEKTRP